MGVLTPERVYVEELLDAGVGSDDDVAANLSDLRRINRMLGGSKVVLRALEATSAGAAELTLLDVGTGSADIPNEIVAWSDSRGIKSRIVALDISERNLRVASQRLGVSPEVGLLRADAMRLPFASRSFDYVTASLMLHHFRDEDVVSLLAEFSRVARRVVIVNDLVRNLVPYYFIRITAPLAASSFLTRHDGPISVLRGFTVDELRELAARAGLDRCRVKRVFPYRLLMVAETGRSTANHASPIPPHSSLKLI